VTTSAERGETTHWGDLEGVSIDFPIVVDEMNSATLVYTVPHAAASALLPGDAFEVAETAPGSAVLVIALCDYLQNPWGDYLEINLGLLVHPTGRPDEVGAFQWRMPVDQAFTCLAGNRVLGLPKTVEDLEATYSDDSVTFELRADGASVLRITVPRAEPLGDPTSETTITYSYLDGVATVVPLTIDLPSGIIDSAQVVLELGDGVIADELRSLGLPAVPDYAAWGERLTGSFGVTRPV
jgi:hypothetical protein